jgi:hypothetical protein
MLSPRRTCITASAVRRYDLSHTLERPPVGPVQVRSGASTSVFSQSTGPATFAYIGTGDLTLDWRGFESASVNGSVAHLWVAFAGQSNTVARLELTYEFTPTPVPVLGGPATIVLAILLSGLGMAGSRRRSSRPGRSGRRSRVAAMEPAGKGPWFQRKVWVKGVAVVGLEPTTYGL